MLSSMAAVAEDNSVLHTPAKGWSELNDMEKASVDAGKAKEEFRNYKDSERQGIVQLHYKKMRENQTVEHVLLHLLALGYPCRGQSNAAGPPERTRSRLLAGHVALIADHA